MVQKVSSDACLAILLSRRKDHLQVIRNHDLVSRDVSASMPAAKTFIIALTIVSRRLPSVSDDVHSAQTVDCAESSPFAERFSACQVCTTFPFVPEFDPKFRSTYGARLNQSAFKRHVSRGVDEKDYFYCVCLRSLG